MAAFKVRVFRVGAREREKSGSFLEKIPVFGRNLCRRKLPMDEKVCAHVKMTLGGFARRFFCLFFVLEESPKMRKIHIYGGVHTSSTGDDLYGHMIWVERVSRCFENSLFGARLVNFRGDYRASREFVLCAGRCLKKEEKGFFFKKGWKRV